MRILMLVLISALSSLTHAETYLCEGENSVGFKFDLDSKTWKETIFDSKASLFIVEPSGDDLVNRGFFYQIRLLDNTTDRPDAVCNERYSSDIRLYCKGRLGTYRIHRETGRYIQTFDLGYIESFDEKEQGATQYSKGFYTPFITLGQCIKY